MITNLLTLLWVAGCAVEETGSPDPLGGEVGDEPREPVEKPPGRPGSQIGGIDCDYDKLDVRVVDATGAGLAARVVADFPDGDQITTDCDASGCQLELAGPGTYTLSVSAAGYASVTAVAVLDDDDVIGTTTEDCGAQPVHEDAITIELAEDEGDIMTSHIRLRPHDSQGDPVTGVATVSGPVWPTYVRDCSPSRSCWISIEGPGIYDIEFVSAAGERGETTVTIGPADITGTNELGDTVYERSVRLDLRR